MTDAAWLKEFIRDIPDFPKPGVVFKDFTPLLASAEAFKATIDAMCEPFDGLQIDKVLGVEARGFILAAPVAYRFGAGFVPVRKAGKLPWHIEKEQYELEYGTDLLEIHRDALAPGERTLVIDDVMATGGTAAATIRLVEKLGGEVAGLGFVIELGFLGGRDKLGDHEAHALLTYE
ncbi:MAG TPA: adenine phosphoribosyltransferase [Acidimicrobiales bacterium]